MADFSAYIDFSQSSLKVSAACIAFNPLFWNIVARQEYRNHYLSKLFGGRYNGCYFLAFTIFMLGLNRDYFYKKALDDQPYFLPIHQPYFAYALFTMGNILVLSSMWALGITGTYLGDYFGILMESPVTSFPFNVTSAPMYWGSTMSFLGVALYNGKVAGLLLTAEVYICYLIACRWEDPFTAGIYAKRDQERAKSK